jgi:hypothetical protein
MYLLSPQVLAEIVFNPYNDACFATIKKTSVRELPWLV